MVGHMNDVFRKRCFQTCIGNLFRRVAFVLLAFLPHFWLKFVWNCSSWNGTTDCPKKDKIGLSTIVFSKANRISCCCVQIRSRVPDGFVVPSSQICKLLLPVCWLLACWLMLACLL